MGGCAADADGFAFVPVTDVVGRAATPVTRAAALAVFSSAVKLSGGTPGWGATEYSLTSEGKGPAVVFSANPVALCVGLWVGLSRSAVGEQAVHPMAHASMIQMLMIFLDI